MSVIIQTSLGEFTVDLFYQQCPNLTRNFINLCRQKFYNNAIVSDIQKDILCSIIQPLEPKGKTHDGNVIKDEIHPTLTHSAPGLLSTSNQGPHLNNSNFFITFNEQPKFNHYHSVFGQISENIEILQAFNQAYIDANGKPLKTVRIMHTFVIFDPFEDEVEDMESPMEILSDLEEDRSVEEIKKETEKLQVKTWSNMLEMIQDIPDADMALPENVLFVCKLNECTNEEDLEVIFGRFGGIRSCEVVRDWKTGDSLQYAFIEFETDKACEEAYWKMENALIDQRRIHVDFSQSSRKMWPKYMKKMKENKLQQMTSNEPVLKENRRANNRYDMVFEGEQQNNQKSYQQVRSKSRDRKKSKSIDRKKRDKSRSRDRKRRSRSRSDRKRRSRSRSDRKKRSRDQKKHK